LANYRFRFLFLIPLLLTLSYTSVYGQRTLGVSWDIPEHQQQAIAELQTFHELGISIIEVQRSPNAAVWQQIDSLGFEVYGSLGIRFPTSSTFRKPDSTLINDIEDKASEYLTKSSVSAIGLFGYGAVEKPSFWNALIPLAKQLKTDRQLPFYFTGQRTTKVDSLSNYFIILETPVTASTVDSLTVPQDTLIGGYRYAPSDRLKTFITPFKQFLEKTSTEAQKPIFINSSWLLSMEQQHPQFAQTLQTLTTEENAVFPLPKETVPTPQSSSLPIIVLLVVWGTIAFHYHSSPLYRKSIFRYFTAHKFFINDIFQRQIRSPLPSIIIILQHAFLLGAAVFITAISILSPLGQTAFFYHLPQLAILGNNPYSFLGLALIASVIVSFFSAIWLYLGHKSINSFTQIATIYAWPLQVNFILTTTAITLYASGATTVSIVILTSLALLLFLLTFFVAAIDATRLSRSIALFQFKTTIPYTLILVGLLTWIILQEQLLEAISLALTLK